MPPSQCALPFTITGGKPGGSAPLAMMCSGPMGWLGWPLSKVTSLPLSTSTAHTVQRTWRSLR